MFRLSCFADEISPDPREQVRVMARNGIRFLELRSVWDRNVLDLSDDECRFLGALWADHGIGVSSIGSPVGKVPVECDFPEHLRRFERAVEIASLLSAPSIRVFSFYMDAPDRDRHEEVVVDRLRRMAAIAAAHSLRLLHENEAGIFGETSANCRKLFAAIPDDAFQAVFDPSNFVAAGEDAFDESFPALRDRIGYLHVKDSVRETGTIVVAGRGDGRLREILDALRDRDGLFLSLEPHLSLAGPFRGFTGPELFEEDFRALTAMLRELDIRYG